MTIAIEQLSTRLQQGETLEELLRSFLPEAARELLKRCATVRTFDERLVNEVFRPEVKGGGPPEVPFATLVGQDFVEQVAEGVYRLRASARREYFEMWWGSERNEKIPSPLRALSRKLVAYYQQLGRGRELDVLYHLIAVDARKAKTLFNELYKAADAVFDLGRCQDLLQVLEERQTLSERQPLLDHNLRQLFTERQYYFKARCLWSREYYQTVYYYEIKQLDRAFEDLLNDKQHWILQLFAPGGMGKTMFNRWLTARRCVPEPWKIPCALVDFDSIDPVTATQNPWMLVLDVAQQLNEQIPNNLFSEQLGDLREYRQHLLRTDPATPPRSGTPPGQPLADIPNRFAKALKSAKLKKKVVLIFDTLEEVILYQGTNLMALLREVKKLHDQYTDFRLILSGRYDLAEKLDGGERLPGFAAEFGDFTRPLKLEPFADPDAKKYLIEKRGLNRIKQRNIARLLAAVVAQAKGNPFKLSLYADLLRASPHITEREIRESPSDLLYLIRRILLRIPDARARWLLRYGVVPRKLTLAFVKDVMAPYLPKAMSGTSTLDDPENELPEVLRKENAFSKVLASPHEQVDVEQLWQTLTRYASGYSWVSPDKEANTLSFHPEVSVPMRALLSKQKIFRRLHRAAIKHYEKRAKKEPERWDDLIREAVYHKFQVAGAAAASYWREQIEHPMVAARPEGRRTLAREVLDLATAQDEDPTPVAPRLVEQPLRAQAYFETALANVEIARASQANQLDPNWQEAGKMFAAYEQLQKKLPKAAIAPARAAFVRAALLDIQGKTGLARRILADALRRKGSARDKLNLELALADLLQRTAHQREAVRYYCAALKLAPKARVNARGVLEIRKKLAEHYEFTGDLKLAAHEYQLALQQATKTNQNLLGLQLARRLAEVNLKMCNLAEARAHAYKPYKYDLTNLSISPPASLKSGPNEARTEVLHYYFLQGWVELLARDPIAAVQCCAAGIKAVEQALAEGGPTVSLQLQRLYAQNCELLGRARAELCEHREALDMLELARSRWRDVSDNEGVNRCMLYTAEIQLRVLGSVKAARFTLEQSEQLTAQDLPDLCVRRETLWIEVLDQQNRPKEAQKRLQNLEALAKKKKCVPGERARVAIANMLHRARRGLTVPTRELTTTLKSVQPPAARLGLLAELRWCPTPKKVSKQHATAFAGLLPEPRWGKEDGPGDALIAAEALRAAGRSRAPLSLLDQAAPLFAARHNQFALHDVWTALDRLGRSDQTPDFSQKVAEFVTVFAPYSLLCLDVRLAHADRLLAAGQHDAAQKLLDEIEQTIPQDESTRWLAQFYDLRGRLLIESGIIAALAQHEEARTKSSSRASIVRGIGFLSRAVKTYEALGAHAEAKRLDQLATAERIRPEAAQRSKSARKKVKGTGRAASAKGQPKMSAAQTYQKLATRFARLNDPGRHTYVVKARRLSGAGDLTITTGFGDATAPMRRFKPRHSILPMLLEVRPGEVVSKEFVDVFPEHWFSISKALSDLIGGDKFASSPVRPSKSMLDFRLELDDPVLAAVPWELALLATYYKRAHGLRLLRYMYRAVTNDNLSRSWSVRSLQYALMKFLSEEMPVDGIYGRLTQQAVKKFQHKAGLPASGIADERTWDKLRKMLRARKSPAAPEVLIVQASRQQQVLAARGHASSGISLSSFYSYQHAKVTVLENPPLNVLSDYLRRIDAQVLHLCPVMRRSPHVGIYLDFSGVATRTTKFSYNRSDWDGLSGSGGATTEATPISLTWLGRLLEENAERRKRRPLLVLDVPRPPVIGEALLQLMLRNAFASEIFRLNNTSAVLTTGLDRTGETTYLLVASLMQNMSFGETANAIRKSGYEHLKWHKRLPDSSLVLEEIIHSLGTALFTHDPTGWVF
jgi:cellulose synthase operon protein C